MGYIFQNSFAYIHLVLQFCVSWCGHHMLCLRFEWVLCIFFTKFSNNSSDSELGLIDLNVLLTNKSDFITTLNAHYTNLYSIWRQIVHVIKCDPESTFQRKLTMVVEYVFVKIAYKMNLLLVINLHTRIGFLMQTIWLLTAGD